MPTFCKFHSSTNTVVIEAGGTGAFEITAEPDVLPGATLTAQGDASLEVGALEIGADGKTVRLTVTAGPGGGHFPVSLVEGRKKTVVWRGTVVVTRVSVFADASLRLQPHHRELLRVAYWDQDEVRVLRQFGGGRSGSAVFQVQGGRAGQPLLPEIVKIANHDAMRDEAQRYGYFKNRLSKAAQVRGPFAHGPWAAIVYNDAHTLGGGSGPIVPFAEFFDHATREELEQALVSVLQEGLGGLYAYHAMEERNLGDLVGTFLPEHLVVDAHPAASGSGGGISEAGNLVATEGEATLAPEDFESASGLPGAGQQILLRGLRVSKVEEDSLNLEDAERRRYKVKVRFDKAAAPTIRAGQEADVRGQVAATREERMAFAVEHCLTRRGFTRCAAGWQLGGECWPDPVEVFRGLMNDSFPVAFGTVHGDLHWENIMLSSPDNWALIDYGLSSDHGPILFDFIKLESYLRATVLSTTPHPATAEVSPAELMAFEEALVANPLGALPDEKFPHSRLEKAARSIRCIRRLARRYGSRDLLEYWKWLFAYSLAFSKYYPLAPRWEDDSLDERARTDRDQGGEDFFRVLATSLALARALKWELSRRPHHPPLPRVEFVGMGSILKPEAGKIAVDVGNRCEAGVLDHHFAGCPHGCAAAAVYAEPQLVTDHLGDANPDGVTWITHHTPDFDAVASLYLAWQRSVLGFFPPGAAELVRSASEVDQGGEFLERARFPERTPYALMVVQLDLARRHPHAGLSPDAAAVAKGFELIDVLLRLELLGTHALDTHFLPHEAGFFNTVRLDRETFLDDDFDQDKVFTCQIARDGQTVDVNGLYLDHPRSQLFKVWARRGTEHGKFPLTVVRYPPAKTDLHRFVISVPQSYQESLRGLGKALEAAECAKRAQLGRERPPPPRWDDVTNSDPWYDGRGHHHTIIDSPREGTVLKKEEVMEIICGGEWME